MHVTSVVLAAVFAWSAIPLLEGLAVFGILLLMGRPPGDAVTGALCAAFAVLGWMQLQARRRRRASERSRSRTR